MQVKLPFSGLRRTVMHSLFINYHSLIAIQIHSYGQYHFCFAKMILLKADTLGVSIRPRTSQELKREIV